MNVKKLLKQAQQMQAKMERDLGETFVDGSSGGGMVIVRMNGHKHIESVKIDPEAIDPEDAGMLEDLIVAAFNDASNKIDESLRDKMSGFPMPGMPGM